LEKAVERGKARKLNTPIPRIEIDEKAFRKGYNYITLFYDLDRSTVEAILTATISTPKILLFISFPNNNWHALKRLPWI
jgi:hypothetical protein